LAETAALFRQECNALDHLIEELYRDVEQLRQELVKKGEDIDEGRRKLAERGRQLAEQRKESGRLVTLLEQQESRAGETLSEVKNLREQLAREREESQQREAARTAFLEQKQRALEGERDQLRHELNVLQATAGSAGGGVGAESLAPLLSELGEMRRQLGDAQEQHNQTQSQLAEARVQLGEAIERSVATAAAHASVVAEGGQPADEQTLAKVGTLERERLELESELELVRTRATELQEVVNQQRRELVEQRADVTTELRLLRELVEQRGSRATPDYEPEEEPALVGAAARGSDSGSAPADPVVSSVMAQFARLQKDVAQRRKKK
jgi:chromosome segregation ATPase